MTKTKYKDIYVDGKNVLKRKKDGSFINLCQWIDNVGYYQVCFRLNKKRIYVRVHRIIAETLIPNPNNYKMINYIDGNKLNNDISNLEWCRNSYNTKETYRLNLYKSRKSCRVKAINKNTKEKFIFDSIRSCAESLKVNRKTVTSILKK